MTDIDKDPKAKLIGDDGLIPEEALDLLAQLRREKIAATERLAEVSRAQQLAEIDQLDTRFRKQQEMLPEANLTKEFEYRHLRKKMWEARSGGIVKTAVGAVTVVLGAALHAPPVVAVGATSLTFAGVALPYYAKLERSRHRITHLNKDRAAILKRFFTGKDLEYFNRDPVSMIDRVKRVGIRQYASLWWRGRPISDAITLVPPNEDDLEKEYGALKGSVEYERRLRFDAVDDNGDYVNDLLRMDQLVLPDDQHAPFLALSQELDREIKGIANIDASIDPATGALRDPTSSLYFRRDEKTGAIIESGVSPLEVTRKLRVHEAASEKSKKSLWQRFKSKFEIHKLPRTAVKTEYLVAAAGLMAGFAWHSPDFFHGLAAAMSLHDLVGSGGTVVGHAFAWGKDAISVDNATIVASTFVATTASRNALPKLRRIEDMATKVVQQTWIDEAGIANRRHNLDIAREEVISQPRPNYLTTLGTPEAEAVDQAQVAYDDHLEAIGEMLAGPERNNAPLRLTAHFGEMFQPSMLDEVGFRVWTEMGIMRGYLDNETDPDRQQTLRGKIFSRVSVVDLSHRNYLQAHPEVAHDMDQARYQGIALEDATLDRMLRDEQVKLRREQANTGGAGFGPGELPVAERIRRAGLIPATEGLPGGAGGGLMD